MTQYVGYHSDSAMPFQQGEKVVIPAGTQVRSLHPSHKATGGRYVTKRATTITVKSLHNGQSRYLYIMGDRERNYHPQFANAYAEFDALREMMRDLDGDDYKLAATWYREMQIHYDNPAVVWPGTGGYWCRADVNDLLAANGKTEMQVAA